MAITQKAGQEKTEVRRLVELARQEGAPDQYGGKRSYLRIQAGIQLELAGDPESAGDTYVISMHNISEGGVAFWSKKSLAIGDVAYIRQFTNDGSCPWLRVSVCHRTRGIRGFLIGCEFTLT